jgi:hypothetical protein
MITPGELNEFGGLTQEGFPEPTDDEPSEDQLSIWVCDSVALATDGCQVEPDGVCEHGYPSWLLYLGLI